MDPDATPQRPDDAPVDPAAAAGAPVAPADVVDPRLAEASAMRRRDLLTSLALLPALGVGIAFAGWRGAIMLAVAMAAGTAVQLSVAAVRRRPLMAGLGGGVNAAVLLTLLLGVAAPLWLVAVAAAFGMLFGREVFGGAGRELIHPALVAKAFILLSYPAYAGALNPPIAMQAHPLAFAAAAGAGALVLAIVRGSRWRVLAGVTGSAALVSLVLWRLGEVDAPDVLLGGAFILGAGFLAPHVPTSPTTRGGQWIFAAFVGVLAALASGPATGAEAIVLAVLLGSFIVPSLDDAVAATLSRRVRR